LTVSYDGIVKLWDTRATITLITLNQHKDKVRVSQSLVLLYYFNDELWMVHSSARLSNLSWNDALILLEDPRMILGSSSMTSF
jgi:hypothetical protein